MHEHVQHVHPFSRIVLVEVPIVDDVQGFGVI